MALITWIAGYYSFQVLSGEVTPTGWIRTLVFGFPAALALYAVLLYEKNHSATLPKLLCKIGDASYSIYLSHVIVLSIIGRFWLLFSSEGYQDNIVMLLIMIISVLLAGYISYIFIEKPLLKKTRILEKQFKKKNKV